MPDEVVSTRFLCGRLALRLSDPAGSIAHIKVGLEAAQRGDPESYTLMLEAMLARATCMDGRLDEGRAMLMHLEGRLTELAVPRHTQVMVVMALAWQALGEQDRAMDCASKAAQVAGTRGFRLWSLYARMIMAEVGGDERSEVAHAESVMLAKDMCARMPPDLAEHFRRRRGIGAMLAED